MSLLQVDHLHVNYQVKTAGRPAQLLRAVQDVSLAIAPGETLGVVGESGSGKSTLARAIMRLVDPASGRIRFEGEDITDLTGPRLLKYRRGLQMVFQDPFGSLDPRLTIGQSLAEPLIIHRHQATSDGRRARIVELLESVGLDETAFARYPSEFSGGQRQRIGIARALSVGPKLLLCDEPVSALDVSVQAQIASLLKELQARQGVSYLFIAHDLAVVSYLSHRILVLYLGRVMEQGTVQEIMHGSRHPYTQSLLAAIPNPDQKTDLPPPLGEIPSPLNPPPGCPFQSRCPLVQEICRKQLPLLKPLTATHASACHLL